MKLPVTINLDQDLLARVDAAAGPSRRSAWVAARLEEALAIKPSTEAPRKRADTQRDYELPKIAQRKS